MCEALELPAGQRLLDVAAVNATLAAARRWCKVTSTVYVLALHLHGRAHSEAEALQLEF